VNFKAIRIAAGFPRLCHHYHCRLSCSSARLGKPDEAKNRNIKLNEAFVDEHIAEADAVAFVRLAIFNPFLKVCMAD